MLGALQNQFHRLQESARGISIPDNLKHNISANLGNVRDFVGDFVPAARGADVDDHVPDAAGSAPGASAAAAGAALPANEALRSDHGASSSAPPGSAAASQQAGSERDWDDDEDVLRLSQASAVLCYFPETGRSA